MTRILRHVKPVIVRVGKKEADGYLFEVRVGDRVVYHGWSRGTKAEALLEAKVCARQLELTPEAK